MTYPLPRITIELEGMKQQIIHAFASHNRDIEEAIEAQLEIAIASYPFESEIYRLSREALSDAIKDALERYFKYGEGKEIIKKAVLERLDKLYD